MKQNQLAGWISCLMEDSIAMVSWIEKEEIKVISVSKKGEKGKPLPYLKYHQKDLRVFLK